MASKAEMIDTLLQDVTRRYESSGDVLKNDLSDEVYRKPFKDFKSGKQEEVITKLEKNGLLELMDEEPIVTNGFLEYPSRRKRGLLLMPEMQMTTLLSLVIWGCLIP